MPSSQQYWSAEAGSGGAFENLVLSVVGMRGDLWVVSGLFGMVCNGFRRAYARELRTPPSPPATQSHPTFRSGQILSFSLPARDSQYQLERRGHAIMVQLMPVSALQLVLRIWPLRKIECWLGMVRGEDRREGDEGGRRCAG